MTKKNVKQHYLLVTSKSMWLMVLSLTIIGYYTIYFSNLMLYSFLMADLVNYTMLYFSFFLTIIGKRDETSRDLYKKKIAIVALGVITIFIAIYQNPFHDNPIWNIGMMLAVGILQIAKMWLKRKISKEMGITED